MIVSLCPCCGSLVGEPSEITRIKRELSKRLQNLLEALLQAGEDGISAGNLAAKLYGPRIADTAAVRNTLQQDIRNLRRKVERYGFSIPALRPYRSNYRISKLEEQLCA